MLALGNQIIFHIRSMPTLSKVVAIIGAGRIGSWTAFNLAKKGVKNFVLIDDDRVSEDNVKTWGEVPYTFFDLDDYKVDILRKRLLKMYPYINIKRYRMRITPRTSRRKIEEIFAGVTLIIFAVDTREGLELTENVQIMSSHLAIIPAMHAERGGGHIIVWVPFATPCPKHSMGLESFDNIIESRAHEADINIRDIMKISKYTADIAEYLLFWRIKNFGKSINLKRSNYLHADRLIFGVYRKQWLPKLGNTDCFLCNLNIL